MRLLCEQEEEEEESDGGMQWTHVYEERVMVGVRTYLDAEDRQVVEPVQVLQLSDLIRAQEQTVQWIERVQILDDLERRNTGAWEQALF